MGTKLPVLSRDAFEEEMLESARSSSVVLRPPVLEALWIHYQELLRWNPKLSLIGPGTSHALIQRHYGESLAALPHLPATASVLDAGSGGGFPGFALAAARPGLDVTLLEPKQRKWSFLNTVIRKVKAAGIELSCRALDARVDSPLPDSPALPRQIDIVTCRALALGRERLEALARSYPGVRFLLWTSDPQSHDPSPSDETRSQETPTLASPPGGNGERAQLQASPGRNGQVGGQDDEWPPTYRVAGRIHLPGSRRRIILDLTRTSE